MSSTELPAPADRQIQRQSPPARRGSEWARFLLTIFFARRRVIVLVPVFCMLVAGIAGTLLPGVYEAEFVVLIKAPEVDRGVVGENTDVVIRPGRIEKNLLADEYHILSSPDLARRVADELIANGTVPGGDSGDASANAIANNAVAMPADEMTGKLVKMLASKIVITPVKESDVIKVALRHKDAHFLQQAIRTFARQYLDFRKEVWFDVKSQDFFQGLARESLQHWQSLLRERKQLRTQSAQLDPTVGRAGLQDKLAANARQLQLLEQEFNHLKSKLQRLEKLDPADSITFLDDETRDNRLFWQLKIDIGQAKARRYELLQNHSANSAIVRKNDLQLRGLYREYRRLMASLLENRLASIASQREVLVDQNRKTETSLGELDALEQTMEVLNENIELARAQYSTYQKKAQELANQASSRRILEGSVRIISDPVVGTDPVWPKVGVMVFIAGFLGFFLTLVVAVVQWMMRDAYSLPEEVTEHLGLPVVAAFSQQHGHR